MKNIRNKVLMFLVLSIVSVNICACSKNDELAVYKTNMESFFTEVSSCNDAMNSIDPNADDAPSQLLTYIDKLNEDFSLMASYDVPKEFKAAEALADEAADNMTRAALSYHEAYDGDFNADAESTASQYYERAFVRIQYIVTILHGEIPEGDGVTVTTQEAGQIDPIEGETSEQ
ncbi:hypothetical protein [Butyrivibrio fibrisolvens]|uniref:hypothetical protein n=1 Tax=Butyrivibrio fibrisolvens TaxID=831 RepID=UPI00048716F0|nr:hypothetical protein [Butyrivibrio fibrisolvens]